MNKPNPAEYPAFFQGIISLVGEGDFFDLLDANTNETIAFYQSIDPAMLNHRYAADKWTIKEVLMHCIDTERAFAHRALVCGRCDEKTILYGMDEKHYAAQIDVTHKTIENLLREFQIVRSNSKVLFENFNDAQTSFMGNARTYQISARALGYLMIGHFVHHSKIIKERYLA